MPKEAHGATSQAKVRDCRGAQFPNQPKPKEHQAHIQANLKSMGFLRLQKREREREIIRLNHEISRHQYDHTQSVGFFALEIEGCYETCAATNINQSQVQALPVPQQKRSEL